MKLRTKTLIIVAVIVVYVQIGHLFAYYAMYVKCFPKSTTAKILVPFSPPIEGSPFNDGTPDIRVQEGYSDFTTYYQENLSKRYLFIAVWPIMIMVYLLAAFSWIAFGLYWVVTGKLLRWMSLLP